MNPLVWWQRLLALPNQSRIKTFSVALLLALASATAVSVTAVTLRPLQEANREAQREARMEALVAALPGMGELLRDTGVEALETRWVDLETGTYAEGFDAEGYDPIRAATDARQSTVLTPEADIAGLSRRENVAPVYLLTRDGEIVLIVLPIRGSGYQSTIHAYLALEADLNTIAGLTVYDQGETPGLGARIEDEAWQALWPGKEIADAEGTIRIAVVRGEATGPFEVDGITGATRTSNAMSDIVRFWLGDMGFGAFLTTLRFDRIAPDEPGRTPLPIEPDEVVEPLQQEPIWLALADRHQSFGLACDDCHAQEPAADPATPFATVAPTSVCLSCHGTYATVAERTAALFPNPHESHLGELACESCHRAHEPPVDYCAQCHNFGFNVP